MTGARRVGHGRAMFAFDDLLTLRPGALWGQFHAPVIGALAALVAILAGRWRRWPLLMVAAGPLGVCLGWLLLARSLTAGGAAAAWTLLPVGLAAAVLCPLAGRLLPRHAAMACLVPLALGSGWWLAGAPRQAAVLAQAGILLAGLVIVLGLGGRMLARGGPWRMLFCALILVGALWVAKAPSVWLLLALAPALASLALLAAPLAGELLVLPLAIDLLATAMAAMLAEGRMPRLGLNAIDIATLAPVLTPVLAGLLGRRLRWPAPLTAIIAGGIVIFLAWAGRMWLAG